MQEGRRVEDLPMKRVRIAKGKHVLISDELSERAARVFASGLTRDQVLDLMAHEPCHAVGLMAGSRKPLALSKSRRTGHGATTNSALPNENSALATRED
jgi:hypothetical protein